MTKTPPLEKVYEAWSAIADGRVTLQGPNQATVRSSDGTKLYTIKHDPDTDTYSSNDPATSWQGYPGYPVIAVMMLRGTLPLDYSYAQQWAGINWTELNSKYKRDYAAASAAVASERHIDLSRAEEKARNVIGIISALPMNVKRLNSPLV